MKLLNSIPVIKTYIESASQCLPLIVMDSNNTASMEFLQQWEQYLQLIADRNQRQYNSREPMLDLNR